MRLARSHAKCIYIHTHTDMCWAGVREEEKNAASERASICCSQRTRRARDTDPSQRVNARAASARGLERLIYERAELHERV